MARIPALDLTCHSFQCYGMASTKKTPTVQVTKGKTKRGTTKTVEKVVPPRRGFNGSPRRAPVTEAVKPEDLKSTTQKTWGADLEPKERQFVLEYIACYNGSEAARRAGYTGDVGAYACMTLKKPKVAAAVVAAIEEREQRTQITGDRVLMEVHAMAFVDVGDIYDERGVLLPLSKMPPAARKAIVSIETEELFEGQGKDRVWRGYVKKVRLASKESMVALAGKHLAMFQDRVKVDADLQLTVVTGVPDKVGE